MSAPPCPVSPPPPPLPPLTPFLPSPPPRTTVSYVASINTIGNGLVIDLHAEMPAISPKGGFGGMSGPAVKYTALANVKKMRELLDESIDIIGVGGVETGADAFEMILCGAKAVQVSNPTS